MRKTTRANEKVSQREENCKVAFKQHTQRYINPDTSDTQPIRVKILHNKLREFKTKLKIILI